MKATYILGLGLLIAGLSGCGDFQVVLPTRVPADRSWAAYEKNGRLARAYWEYRHVQPENQELIEKAIEHWELQHAIDPTAKEPLQNLAIAHYVLAHYFITDEDKDQETYGRGWEYARLGLMNNPKIAADYEKDPESIHEAIKAHMTITDIPCAYWFGVNWARVIENESIAKRAVAAPKVKEIMESVYERAESYYFYAVHRFFGAYYCKAPGQEDPGNNSKQAFETAIAKVPDYLENKALMAEYYCVFTYDEERFDQLLDEILTAPDETKPEYRFDNYQAKKRARKLKENKYDHF